MMNQIWHIFHLSRGEKALAMAYAAVAAATAGITIMIMSGVVEAQALPMHPAGYDAWIVFVGAFSGAAALYLTRSWMGLSGAIGMLRAVVGGCATAIVASLIAGTLIVPFYGTLFAPVLLLAAVGLKPWLALAWLLLVMMTHYLMVRRAIEVRQAASKQDDTVIGQLSPLSKANLYHHRNHLH